MIGQDFFEGRLQMTRRGGSIICYSSAHIMVQNNNTEDDNATWLHRAYYEETLKVYSTAWSLYISFYTVFLTANVAGLGIVLEYVPRGDKWPIALAFGIQNVITAVTSFSMSKYSLETSDKLSAIAHSMVTTAPGDPCADSVVQGSPIPESLSKRAGYGNCFACCCHIGSWVAVCLINNQIK
jgi:hypothetical protein